MSKKIYVIVGINGWNEDDYGDLLFSVDNRALVEQIIQEANNNQRKLAKFNFKEWEKEYKINHPKPIKVTKPQPPLVNEESIKFAVRSFSPSYKEYLLKQNAYESYWEELRKWQKESKQAFSLARKQAITWSDEIQLSIRTDLEKYLFADSNDVECYVFYRFKEIELF